MNRLEKNVVTPTERLIELAALLPEEPKRKPGRPSKHIKGYSPKDGKGIDVHLWVAEHLPGTTIVREKQFDGGMSYVLSECPFDPSHGQDSRIIQFPSGAVTFMCFHNSCQDNNWHTLRERFDPRDESLTGKRDKSRTDVSQLSENTGLPIIEVANVQLRDAVGKTIEAINNAGEKDKPVLYVRSGHLVRIVLDDNNNPVIDMITCRSMPGIMSSVANFVRITKAVPIEVFPPESLASAIVNKGSWPFPALRGIIEVPTLREDGSIIDKPGYDPISKLYYAPLGSIPHVKDNPSKDDAVKAAAFIADIFCDFPFADDKSSLSNMLGYMVTVVVRELIVLVPLGLFDAPGAGTGKGLLAKAIVISATGRDIGMTTLPESPEETRKKITSLLMSGASVVVFDNVEKTVYDASLASVLTTEVWSDRLLGTNEVVETSNRAIWLMTGNNIVLSGDIPRRAVKIRLNADMIRPWERDSRDFKHSLPEYFFENREKIITALLTMARAWVVAGKPSWSGRPLGSFEQWSRVVGGILEFSGIEGFLGNIDELYDSVSNEDYAQWCDFLGVMFSEFGTASFTTKELMMRIFSPLPAKIMSLTPGSLSLVSSNLMQNVPGELGNTQDNGFSRRLGRALARRRDQLFETGGRIVTIRAHKDTHSKQYKWQLEQVE